MIGETDSTISIKRNIEINPMKSVQFIKLKDELQLEKTMF